MDVVFHVNQSERLAHTLANISNILKFDDIGHVSVVFNGEAVRMFKRSCDWMDGMNMERISLEVCENSLMSHHVTLEEPRLRVIPSGVYRLAQLQNSGFSYIKP